jgi:predicted acyl esterase
VRLYLQQAGTWLESPTWPPPGTTTVHRHLRPGGTLTEAVEDGDAAPSPV